MTREYLEVKLSTFPLIRNVSEFQHHSLLFEEGNLLHFIAKGSFKVTLGFLLQFLKKIDFQSNHHLLPELLRGAGETAFLVQGDKHMGWEGHLQISIGSERQHLDDNRTFHNQKHRRFRHRVNFCQTSSVFSDPLDLLDHPLLLDIFFLGTPQ